MTARKDAYTTGSSGRGMSRAEAEMLVLTARELADLDRLRAAEAAGSLGGGGRRRKAALLAAREAYAGEVAATVAEASRILAGLPKDPPAVLAWRRAVLAGDAVLSVRALAEAMLDALPEDPDAMRHRRLLARGSMRWVGDDLAPWRTVDEDEWSSTELRAAAVRYRRGARDVETLAANAAMSRIEKRRTRGRGVGATTAQPLASDLLSGREEAPATREATTP